MATEYEWKFQATPQVLAAIKDAFAADGAQLAMETTYYDTPSGSLSERHYTLRRRLENGISVCALKAPANGGRAEWEIPCGQIAEAIGHFSALDCPKDFPDLVKEGVIPICSAKFTRIAKTLSFPEGAVELALDEGILTGGDRELPVCEVEVELKEGSARLCDLFAKTLAQRFGLVVEPRSKFRRALALYKGE